MVFLLTLQLGYILIMDLITIRELNDIPLQKSRGAGLKILCPQETEPKQTTKTIKEKLMKGRATMPTETISRAMVAAGFAGVEFGNPTAQGPKKSSVLLKFAKVDDLLEMGGYQATLTDADIKAELDRRKKVVEEAAKKKPV